MKRGEIISTLSAALVQFINSAEFLGFAEAFIGIVIFLVILEYIYQILLIRQLVISRKLILGIILVSLVYIVLLVIYMHPQPKINTGLSGFSIGEAAYGFAPAPTGFELTGIVEFTVGVVSGTISGIISGVAVVIICRKKGLM